MRDPAVLIRFCQDAMKWYVDKLESIVRVKFNVEFTRQAVSFPIRYCYDYMCFDKYQLDQDLHIWHLTKRLWFTTNPNRDPRHHS